MNEELRVPQEYCYDIFAWIKAPYRGIILLGGTFLSQLAKVLNMVL